MGIDRKIRTAVLLMCVTTAALCYARPAHAQDAGAWERSLQIARSAYERDVQELRTEVQGFLSGQLEETLAAADTQRAGALREHIAAFEAEGTLPEDPRSARWASTYERAAGNLMRAYGRTITAYESMGMADQASGLEDDLDLFRVMWDLAPWRPGLSTPETLFVGAETERTFRTEENGLYRLEVVARRVGNEGRLVVVASLPEAGRVRATCQTDASGQVHLLLTLGENVASADLGVSGTLEYLEAGDDQPGEVMLHAHGGGFAVESVRVKPWSEIEARDLTEGRPTREPRERGQRRAAKRPKPAALIDRIEVDRTWRGEMRRTGQPNIQVVLRVNRKTETHVYMHADLPGSGGLEYTFRSAGSSLTLESVRPTGTRGGNYHDASGRLQIQDDQMHFAYRFKYTRGNQRNQNVEGEMYLRKD